MKTNAQRIHSFGGPEVLEWTEVDVPDPGEGEAQIRHTAVGLNFIDTYHRTGLYPVDLPTGLGSEAAGIVEAVGPGVTDVNVGDRVVYTGRPADAYSELRNFSAWQLMPIPNDISDEQAAAVLLKGLTAWYLLRRSYRVQEGDAVLLYAAAGGVGSLASQWGSHLGAKVIGVVSTDEKAELAQGNGCEHVIMADDNDVPGTVKKLTGGDGVAGGQRLVAARLVALAGGLPAARPVGDLCHVGYHAHGVVVVDAGADEPRQPADQVLACALVGHCRLPMFLRGDPSMGLARMGLPLYFRST
jgi:NADPH2:quinone reductase